MSFKPVIGLPGRRKRGEDIAGVPDAFAGHAMDLYFADYAQGVIAAGGVPFHIPMDLDPAHAVAHLHGVLLTGGTDIDPSHYGATAHPANLDPEADRDTLELALVTQAFAEELPVLGICRGLQIMNVAGGGTLHQDIPPHAERDAPPGDLQHEVQTTDGTTMRALYGTRLEVNTIHHQAVDQLAAGYAVTATAPDGVIEAIEHTERPAIAVQWHPELLPSRDTDPVFRWIVEQARAIATQR